MKKKAIEYKVTETGCWECTSHATGKDGYPRAKQGGKTKPISHYMYEKYIGEIPKGLIIRHKCDNPLCINPDHLETGTHQENMNDMVERGRSRGLKGSFNKAAKLNEDDILLIIAEYKNGKSIIAIGDKYSVSKAAIEAIVNRKTWKHINVDYSIEEITNDHKKNLRRKLTVNNLKPPKGSRHPVAKLDESDIASIFERIRNGEKQKDIATYYGVGPTAISKIIRGVNWKHVITKHDIGA
jgi:DNA invertase Pin-like site-specific DNA recombinase